MKIFGRSQTALMCMIFMFIILSSVSACSETSSGDEDAGMDASEPDNHSTGSECSTDNDCSTQGDTCVEGYCSHQCDSFDDCPEAFTCGLTEKSDLFCVPNRHDSAQGTGCAIEECPDGYECFERAEGDQEAFCTAECSSDRDCPPDMACRDYNGSKSCFPRKWCEPCSIDDQCAGGYDRCLESAGGQGYCSIRCNPQDEGTCPADSVCTEQADSEYYCEPAGGECVGDGDYCSLCRSDGDCTGDGSRCYYSIRLQNKFCTRSCSEDSACPDEHACFYVNYDDPSEGSECRPRSDSCSAPSGGMEMSDECTNFWDCKEGECLGWGTHDYMGIAQGARHCTDLCDTESSDDCGNPYLDCIRIDGGEYAPGFYIDLCLPAEGWDGDRFKLCMEECPDGPDDCEWEKDRIERTGKGYCSDYEAPAEDAGVSDAGDGGA